MGFQQKVNVMPKEKIVFETTKNFNDVLRAFVTGKRRSLHCGGTSSSKTWSILQFLIYVAETSPVPLLISVVSESLPHLKKGAVRDFFLILDESQDNNPYFNKSEMMYSRPSWKGRIEFFGADEQGKVRGPRRDILFINEGNNVPWPTAQGLDVRTSRFTIVDWNPVGEFWVHQYDSDGEVVKGWITETEKNSYSHSTYLDAKRVLPKSVVEAIESYKDKDPNWFNVYGLGNMGKVTGLVYPHFEQEWVENGVVKWDGLALPLGDILYGLDFGFAEDPVVLTGNVITGDRLFSDQIIYKNGMTNDVLSREMDLCGLRKNYDEIIADSAEPKAIKELRDKGWNVKPCEKGQGSVEFGHQKVNQYLQYWTKRSLQCIQEQRNFRYIFDEKTGKFTEKTTHIYSHGMDSRRYAVPKMDRDGSILPFAVSERDNFSGHFRGNTLRELATGHSRRR
jgi:phage terminase large subunit